MSATEFLVRIQDKKIGPMVRYGNNIYARNWRLDLKFLPRGLSDYERKTWRRYGIHYELETTVGLKYHEGVPQAEDNLVFVELHLESRNTRVIEKFRQKFGNDAKPWRFEQNPWYRISQGSVNLEGLTDEQALQQIADLFKALYDRVNAKVEEILQGRI